MILIKHNVKDKERMDKVEIWEVLVMLSGNEISLKEAHSQICSLPDVVKSLPTDECVEQWWAEGQDQKKGFWQEAPYRTNGDVVEEIKTALKYFIETWQR